MNRLAFPTALAAVALSTSLLTAQAETWGRHRRPTSPCNGDLVYFDSTWQNSSYTVDGETPQWFFPNWSSQYDVACIDGNSWVPAIWSNSCPLGCRRLTFKMKGRDHDDDTIGFVLGFCDGDQTDPDADYLAVLWNDDEDTKQLSGCGPRVTHPKGMRLVRVFGVPDPSEFWAQDNFDLPCSDLNSGVEVLASAMTRDDRGWPRDTAVHVKVELTPTNLKVWIDGTLEFDRNDDYTPYIMGCFGYYSQSQFADFWNLESEPINPVWARWDNYGMGTPGCYGVPSLELDDYPVTGTTVDIEIGNAGPANATCAMVWGWAPEDLFVPLLGGHLLVHAPFITVVPIDVPPGGLDVDCQIADDACAAGTHLYLQVICIDSCGPAGLALSRGLDIRIGDQ